MLQTRRSQSCLIQTSYVDKHRQLTQVIAQGVDAAPLVHHIRTHAEDNAMQIASLCSIAENFTPARLFLVGLGFDGGENFLELTNNFRIVDRLVEETADGMFGLPRKLVPEDLKVVMVKTYLINLSPLCQPPRRLAQKRTKSQHD